MRLEASVEIRRPVAEVFEYLSDVGHYPRWMAHVVEVRTAAPGAPREGDRFVVTIRSLGRRFETPYVRTSYEAGRRCTDRATGGPVPDQRWHSAVEEVPGGTRVTRAVEVASRGWLRLLQPLQKRAAGRQLGEDLRTLKRVIEGS
ncbi:SRPBCC family protein [Miltoncostaea marina]|uniref:SRPBCC family protein n=1 Tax=Miltoncostaea marina TaxID=2843215 RepID=UPI001C3D7F47|nr:SRPBCC family protein [Miltoncostaea marina]